MTLKDLSGKSVYGLDREDFEKLFCQHCLEYEECPISWTLDCGICFIASDRMAKTE